MRTRLWMAMLGVVLTVALPAVSEEKGAAMKKPDASKAFVEVLDDAFKAVAAADAEVRRVAEGLKFTEGPVWSEAEKGFLFSDVPADRVYRWTETDGLKVWREPSHNTNGNAVDPQGRVVSCEHGSRRVTRTGKDGQVETLCAAHEGKRLNSPNDVAVQRDGTIWFTDPPYGIKRELIEQAGNYVYRLEPGAKEPVAAATDFSMPNGLCFSPDEKVLYVADSGQPHHIRRFRVKGDKTLEGGEVFVTINPGVPDGIRCDRDGRLYSSAGDGVHVFSPEGKLLGKIRTPESPANCAFGGPDFRTFFITARTSVYAVRLNVPGAK